MKSIIYCSYYGFLSVRSGSTPTFVHGLETDAINGGVYLSATASELDSEEIWLSQV